MSRPMRSGGQSVRNGQQPPSHGIFSVPTPIKELFDKFPLRTYAGNELPQRTSQSRDIHTLYVFNTEDGAQRGGPSYNPACLKWQAYLKFSSIPFRTASANNHASPSGALPFLLPATSGPSEAIQPIVSGKLQRWASANSAKAIDEPGDLRYEAYLSLLDHRIRKAWLYSIYMSSNSASIAEPLYILPTSRNPLVRLTIARQLQLAAEKELAKFSKVIDADKLHKEADVAFVALEALLGKDDWFFGSDRPGLFDASVFAYTHLLLDERLGRGWVDSRLRDALRTRERLVRHRDRIVSRYFAGER